MFASEYFSLDKYEKQQLSAATESNVIEIPNSKFLGIASFAFLLWFLSFLSVTC